MNMSEVIFVVVLLAIAALLWWFGFIATKRMRVEKNAMREVQAKKNLELLARQQAEEAATEELSNEEASRAEKG